MSKPASSPKSFEAAVSELETIVQDMESGKLPLEQALEHYQKGVTLLKFCQKTLTSAEQRIRRLENDALVDFALDGETGNT